MGTIVTLPPPRRRRRASVQAGDEATILLFMGVRYVRDHESQQAQPPSRVIVPHREPAPLEMA